MRNLRHLNTSNNPALPEAFCRVADSLRETQLLLRDAGEYFARAPRAQAAVLALMCLKKSAAREGSVWQWVPRDVVLIIARLVHASRHEEAWTFRGKRKAI